MCGKSEQVCAGHTPGPWFASGEDGEVYSKSEYTSVAMVLMNGYGRANGHLIAAAPDLLAALKAMDATLCEGFETQAGRMAGRKALIAARAAISKAEGRA